MKTIVYNITLVENALVTGIEGEPNSKISLNYLPGSALRGAAIAAERRGSARGGYSSPSPWLLNGSVRFLNGYPVDSQSRRRAMPTPLSWHVEKGHASPAYDFAAPELQSGAPDATRQYQPVRAPFYISDGDNAAGGAITVSPKRNLAIHTRRNRLAGAATEVDGDVFRYDALAAGQSFRAAVLLDDGVDVQIVHDVIARIRSLGGSRAGGYGRVDVRIISDAADQGKPCPWLREQWSETGNAQALAGSGLWIMALLSDAILTDENGQNCVTVAVMERAVRAHVPNATVKQTFMRTVIVGGFNRKWGLPLPQAHAVAMGSVFVLDLPADAASGLTLLESQGVGSRRDEGFGRVAFSNMAVKRVTIESASGRAARVVLQGEGRDVAARMADRMLRQKLDAAIVSTAIDLTVSNRPTRSQISGLRARLRDELLKLPAMRDMAGIPGYLDGLNPDAGKQWTTATVPGNDLAAWIRNICRPAPPEREDLFFVSDLHLDQQDIPEIGSVRPAIMGVPKAPSPELSVEYRLRLIDAVLARAAKQSEANNDRRS